jgi:hypothetical protein
LKLLSFIKEPSFPADIGKGHSLSSYAHCLNSLEIAIHREGGCEGGKERKREK